jgi:GST-like protein
MLEEVGLPYTVRLVDITAGEQFSPDFLTISPNNKIPALIDSDEAGERCVLFESGAILIYLAEKTGLLLATGGKRRAETLSWLFWATSSRCLQERTQFCSWKWTQRARMSFCSIGRTE